MKSGQFKPRPLDISDPDVRAKIRHDYNFTPGWVADGWRKELQKHADNPRRKRPKLEQKVRK